MKPALFDYFRPDTLDAAIELLERHGDEARPIAGGQSLVPAMNLRLATPRVLVDIGGIAALRGWQQTAEGIHVGAMTTQAALLRGANLAASLPLLMAALPHVGHAQTRSRGTIGGSLVYADPSGEIGLVAAALDAVMIVRSRHGERRVKAREFQRGALTTDIRAGELLVGTIFPAAGKDTRFAFRELARRQGDFAMVAVAAQIQGDDLRVAVGGLEEVPLRCDKLISLLRVRGFKRDAVAEAIRTQLEGVAPLADLHASGDYRTHLAANLLEDCLMEILS